MKRRGYTAVIGVLLFLGLTTADQVKSRASYVNQSKDDIFIDEPAQADAIEGSAVDRDVFDNDQVESSGGGPDDEDFVPGSGRFPSEDGSGTGAIPSTTEKILLVPGLAGKTSTSTTTTTTTTELPRLIAKATVSADNENQVPEEVNPPKTGKTNTPPHDENNNLGNDVGRVMGQKAEDRQASFFAQPGILAAVIGGAVVGLLCAILLVMFIVYRMRKKDEGSYPLDEPKRSPTVNSYTRNTKEFYA